MQNPSLSLNKVSQSTNDKSDNRNKTSFSLKNSLQNNQIVDYCTYNFDFLPE